MNDITTTAELKNTITAYLKHWKWFVLSVFIALLFAVISIRYSIRHYNVGSQIQIVQEKNASNELSLFKDLGVFSGSSRLVEDEIEILGSRGNFIDLVKELSINVQILSLGDVINSEVYRNPPFNLTFIAPDSVIQNANFHFFLEFLDTKGFGYSEEEGALNKVFAFGNAIPTEIGDMVLTPSKANLAGLVGKRFKIVLSPVTAVASGIKKSLNIGLLVEQSNIVEVSMETPIPQKGKDIINKLIEIYNRNDVEEKERIANKTSEFIDSRIQLIAGTLSSVDKDAQEMLTEKGMTGSGLEVGAAVQVSASSRQNLENAKVQLQMVSGIKDYLGLETGYEEMPVVDVGSVALAQSTAQYNQLISDRKRLLRSADERNPIIVNLDQQLDGLRNTITSSLSSLERNVGMNVSTLQSQMGRIQGTIYSAPENQMELRNITRKQETTESLYLYLLQKREESQIAFASASPKSKVIDFAHLASSIPVKPRKRITFLASILLGLLVPFGVIYLRELLDTKIHNKHGLETLASDIPVLGELPKLNKKESKLILKDDRSVLAEALRIIRTNLDYLMKTKRKEVGKKRNIVFVTSSVPGEGKTFTSTNLAMILGSTEKKVLLIGADIRNPKFYSFFVGDAVDKLKGKDKQKDVGLTEYLFNTELVASDIINTMLIHNTTIDVIFSGKIPPNPAELLMSKRVGELLQNVSEKYDYVIVDTAPLMVVSDTLLISEYADHIIYVTRAGTTEKNSIDFPLQLVKEGKLRNVSFVVNDVNEGDLGYGGKYGYGYGKSTKKWWKF
ncbi:GumC family protein [Maribacter antarcticus]|uniref:GumC family protein n=1 Tax=Maribacter antarcticus TaxID=505250 RepID=UPI00047B9CC3|nr:polysaccharide biosynthesis tyrosine autokinase [Maribacter antarcticus]